MHRLRATVLAVLLCGCVCGCASTPVGPALAFIDAGAEVRRRQTGHTYEEVRRDLELFTDRDVARVRAKARERLEKVAVRDRWGFAAGTGLATLGVSAGSLQGRAGAVFAIVGLSLASTAVVHYLRSAADLRDCMSFLDRSRERLRAFDESRLSGEGELPQASWEDYVDLTADIQRFRPCLSLR